jgi:hypothetical protein
MDNSPETRTLFELVFSFPEAGDGAIWIRSKLSPKANYAESVMKNALN